MNERGEGWVVGQAVLLAVIALAPGGGDFPRTLRGVGVLLMATGGVVGLLAARGLGRNLTPFPKPRDEGELIRHGLYGYVRHPIYASLVLAALGWALWRSSAVGLGLTVLLFTFFDAKSRQEERWLRQRFPDYAAYQREVKRLIPWLY